MRRGFNKKILPKVAPQRHKRSTPPKKKELKSSLIKDIFRDYREQAGDRYNRDEFAKAIGVKPSTVRRYFFGYFPHRENFGNIARYFEPLINCKAEIIRQDLLDTYKDAKKQ